MNIGISNYGIRALSHAISLPEKGLFLVTAPNASGKTSLFCDAPLIAWFGKTLADRGDPLEKPGGSVHFSLGDLDVERRRKGKSLSVSVRRDGHPVSCDTATKATAYVEAQIGELALWEPLLTMRFQTADAFTLGTDGERKRFVEALLPGLGRFDTALDRCSKDRAAFIRGPLSDAQVGLGRANYALAAAQQRLAAALALEGDAPVFPVDLAEIEKLEKRCQSLDARVRTLRQMEYGAQFATSPEVQAADQAMRSAAQSHQQTQHFLQAAQRGACGVCGSAVSPEQLREREAMEAGARERYLAAQREFNEANEAHRSRVSQQVREVQSELALLLPQLDKEATALNALRANQARVEERRRSGVSVEAVQAEEAAAREDVRRANVELDTRQTELAVMELAERALSPKGVRPALIEDAFQRLQVAANRVLATCWPGAKVRIDRTSTSQTGKVREESRVLIALPGSETFHPVARLNRGMLRRVDLALQIARRRLYASQCSGGKLPIPYFVIDEALDGIDEEGLTGCAAMLAEEAMANLVVVLTHDEKVVRGVPGKRVTL